MTKKNATKVVDKQVKEAEVKFGSLGVDSDNEPGYSKCL